MSIMLYQSCKLKEKPQAWWLILHNMRIVTSIIAILNIIKTMLKVHSMRTLLNNTIKMQLITLYNNYHNQKSSDLIVYLIEVIYQTLGMQKA